MNTVVSYEAVEGLENVYKVTLDDGTVEYFLYIRNKDDTFAFVPVDENGVRLDAPKGGTSEIPENFVHPHARERFKRAGLDLPYGENFRASPAQFAAVDAMLARCKEIETCNGVVITPSIEACAEPNLRNATHVGCIGPKEYELFGIPLPEGEGFKQRRDCLCLPGKTELLENRRQCPHGCLYCYWK